CYLIQNTKIKLLERQIRVLHCGRSESNEEAEAASRIKSVSPMALLALGVAATISELTTALPYFAFLAILFHYQLSLIQVTFILVIYNIIYTLPLIISYLVYIKAQDKFDRLYTILKTQMTKWTNVMAPAVAGMVGILLVFHSISFFLQ
ncbi:MAG TPA: GAP family protein, partial [Syntrophomonas sp.]|nr:GAP family protein [Syntrophomonas sp.]